MNTSANSTSATTPLWLPASPLNPALVVVREHLCGYDLNLTYPQTTGHFPTLHFVNPSNPIRDEFAAAAQAQRFSRSRKTKFALNAVTSVTQKAKRADWLARRDLSGRQQGVIDEWYGCFIYDEMIDYALNFSAPWCESHAPLAGGK